MDNRDNRDKFDRIVARIGNSLGWALGGLFLLFTLLSFNDSLFAAAMMLICALAVIPPTRRVLRGLFKNMTVPQHAVGVLILSTFSIVPWSGGVHDKKEAEARDVAQAQATAQALQAKEEKQRNAQKFNSEKDLILAAAHDQLNSGDYKGVLKNTRVYTSAVNDADLMNIRRQATSELKRIRDEKRTAELSSLLPSISSNDHAKLKKTYQELADLNPDISSYQIKASWYAGEVEAKRQAQLAKKRAKEALQTKRENIKNQFSPGRDNKHFEFARIIKKLAHDPKSFQHIHTSYVETDNFLIVTMRFRAKNRLGALMVDTHTAKFSFNGRFLGLVETE